MSTRYSSTCLTFLACNPAPPLGEVGWGLPLCREGAALSLQLNRIVRLALARGDFVAALVVTADGHLWIIGDVSHRVGIIAAVDVVKRLAADRLVLSTFIIYYCCPLKLQRA